MKVLFLFTIFTYFANILAENEPRCLPSTGGGMQAIFQEFVSKMPIDEIRQLVRNTTAYNPEVQVTVDYLSSKTFLRKLDDHLYQEGMFSFMHFTCTELYTDMNYNFKLLLRLFFSEQKYKNETSGCPKYSGASNDLLLSIIKLIPFNEVKTLFQEKLESDIYLQYYRKMVNSKEFKAIVKVAKASKSYEYLKKDLYRVGVDIIYMNEIIRRIFFEIWSIEMLKLRD